MIKWIVKKIAARWLNQKLVDLAQQKDLTALHEWAGRIADAAYRVQGAAEDGELTSDEVADVIAEVL